MAKQGKIKLSEVEGLTPEDVASLKKLGIIHTTWRDYTLMLLNSTPDPLRSIWREKVVTSTSHWHFNTGSISEGNMAGVEVLAVLPSELTMKVVDDAFEPDGWYKGERLSGSKRMKVFLGHYPQESISNEANLCLKYIVKHWDEYGHLIQEIPLLSRIWKLAQESGGKCIIPDEVLTYILEKPVNDKIYGTWIDVAYDVFENGIPSDKYAEYWKSDKIEDFPLAFKADEETAQFIDRDCNSENGYWVRKYRNNDGALEQIALSLEEQKKNFLNVCDIFFKEDVSMSPCWKKIAICILKNDTSMKYAGFAPTFRERQAREEAIAAFSTKQKEKEKAKAEAERLAAQIENERKKKMM